MVHRTQAELSLVVKDVVFEDGKSVSIVCKGSNAIQYVCSDKSCHWKVYFVRDNVTRTRTKEECMFHVSKNKTKTILTHSAICVSVKKPSLLQLEKMSSMNVAVDGDSQCKGKALLVAARSEGVRLEKRKSTMYAAKNSILKKNDIGEIYEGFQSVGAFMREYMEKNPGSKCTLELDSEDRFMRAFISNDLVVRTQCRNVPVGGLDAGHSKHPDYNGVHLALVGRTGDGKNITYCYGIVPKETIVHYVWFFICARAAGVKLNDMVIFVDRGFQRNSINTLIQLTENGEWDDVNLKYCTRHILRNAAETLNVPGKENNAVLQGVVYELQGTTNAIEFMAIVKKIYNEYGKEGVKYLIFDIHPVNWCVFANNPNNGRTELQKLPRWVGESACN